jgi:hypothetical protein
MLDSGRVYHPQGIMSESALRLRETDVSGHLTFEAPPEGFSPNLASDEELRQYGLPHRPDPKKFPKEARLWLRTMARIKTFKTPKLTVRAGIVHGPRNLEDLTNLPSGGKRVENSTNSIWSGLVANTALLYTQIWGGWTIPEVTAPGFSPCYSSMWIGLNDGRSLFQAGTEQDVLLPPISPENTCYAWYEWFPGPSVSIDLAVLPGQAVSVNLEPLSDGSGRGQVSMINYTTGVAITPIVVSPPPVDFNGNPISPAITGVPSFNAEWILERTSLAENGVPVPQALADFGATGFLFGGAVELDSSTGGKTAFDLLTVGESDRGTLLNMLANDGVTVLSEAVERPGLVLFFTGPTF